MIYLPMKSTSHNNHQVLIAVEAAPINPSDIGPLFMPSHGGIGRFDGAVRSRDEKGRAVTSLPIPERGFAGLKGGKMIGRGTRVGNEGAGTVIAAGKGARAQALKGKMVAAMGPLACAHGLLHEANSFWPSPNFARGGPW